MDLNHFLLEVRDRRFKCDNYVFCVIVVFLNLDSRLVFSDKIRSNDCG